MRMFVPPNLFNKNTHVAILAGTWLVLHSILLWQYGIVTSYEATKYIEQANNLLQTGSYSSHNFLFYSTQILLIVASKKLQIGYGAVVAVQLLLNAISTFFFYKTIEYLTRKSEVAFAFTLGLLCMFYYQLYNVCLFTESLYFSFSILFFYRLCKMKKLGFVQYVEVILFLGLLYFTRPVGIFFIPATFTFLVLKFYRKKAVPIFLSAGLLLLIFFVLLVNYGMKSGGEFNFLLPYLEKQVICGVPSGRKSLKVPIEQNSIQGLLYLLVHYPRWVIALFCKRLFAFFGLIRSNYSFFQNIFVSWFFFTLYFFAFDGIKNQFKNKLPEVLFSTLLIFFAAVTTCLTCDEWYNRFIYAVLPFLMVLASLSFAFTTEKSNNEPAPLETEITA